MFREIQSIHKNRDLSERETCAFVPVTYVLESTGTNRFETFVDEFTIIESAGESVSFDRRNKGGLFSHSRKLKLSTTSETSPVKLHVRLYNFSE